MIAAIDGTVPQLGADSLLVVLIVVNAVVGLYTGTLRRAFALVGLYASFLAAYYTGNGIASFFRKGDVVANAWAFVAVLAASVVVIEVLGHVFADRIGKIAVVAFDRAAGLVVGGIVGLAQALVLFLVALSLGSAGSGNPASASHDSAAKAVRGAALSGRAIGAEPVVRDAVAPLVTDDLTTHLEDGTGATALH